MKPWSFMSRLLLALVLFGLVVGPLAASETMPAMAAEAMVMADGMDCPDQRQVVPDCTKDCPLTVLCASGLVSLSIPETQSFQIHASLRDEFRHGSEAALASLVGEPPPRPPKS
jgi:hypothetical protein